MSFRGDARRAFRGTIGVFGALAMGALTACMTPAEQAASDGLTAFKSCDLRTAANDFEMAHTLDTSRADFALAYALSTLAILPEDPSVTSVLMKLGFTSAIDTSAWWGPGGVLAQLSSQNATCQTVDDYIVSHTPYAPAQKNGPPAASVITDPNLSGNDFVSAAAALGPRLQELVMALEQAANAAPASGTRLQGGCGVGTVVIQAPELYGAAAFLETVRGTVEAAQGYDWGVTASLVLRDPTPVPQYAASLDAHLLHVTSAASLSGSVPTLLHAVELVQSGVAAASAITSRPANSLFDWTSVPPGVLTDVGTLAASAKAMLSMSGMAPLPFVTPTLDIDTLSFFTMPVDATQISPAIWSATPSPDSTEYTLVASTQGLEAQLTPRFSPDPFAQDASFTFTLSNRWQGIPSAQWTAAFDPDKRWDNVYSCK